MNTRRLSIAATALGLLWFSAAPFAEEPKMPFVRIAELEIDAAQLDKYHVADSAEREEQIGRFLA